MKYSCVYIGNRNETIDDQNSSFHYFYDVNEKILYKTEDSRMDQSHYFERKKKTFVEWIKDNLIWIVAFTALLVSALFIKNNLYGWLMIFLFEIGSSMYMRYSAIRKRVAEINEVKQNAQIVEMDVDELKRFYKDSSDAQGMKLVSLLISCAGPILLLVLFLARSNSDWIAAWFLLSHVKYSDFVDALPVNLYRLHIILNRKEDIAVTGLLFGSGLLICIIFLYLFMFTYDRSMLERFPAIAFVVSLATVLVAPLAITGLVVAIQEKKAGKKGAILGILLNLFALIVGMLFLLFFLAGLILGIAQLKGIGI